MPKSWNINLSVTGGDRRNAFSGGNLAKSKGTLQSGMYSNQENGGDITKKNLKSIFGVGFAFQKAQQVNELVGAYTENRLRQRKVNTAMTFAKYGIGIAVNPTLGITYAVGDMVYRGVSYSIDIQKENREANYYKRLSGNNSFSGSRYRGDYQ